MDLQLLNSTSFFQIEPEVIGDVRIIKGFGSTTGLENIDREGEFVKSPFEFDLVTFKNSPQLLLDHDYIKTKEGNSVAAGKVTKAIPAYIKSEDPTNEANWVVHSLTTDEFVSVWPKEKSATLGIDSQGLFIVAEVTQSFAIELLDKGELGAFSWKGYAVTENLGVAKRIKNVDLIEFSMVHTQAERSSTFLLIDEDDPTNKLDIDFTDCEICSIKFAKNVHTLLDVQQYTKQLDLNTYTISESQDSYLVSKSKVLVEKAFEYCSSNGISVLAAPIVKTQTPEYTLIDTPSIQTISENNLMENENLPEDLVPATLLLVDLETFQKSVKNVKIEHSKSTMIGDAPAEIYTAVVEELEVAPAEPEVNADADVEVDAEITPEVAPVEKTAEPEVNSEFNVKVLEALQSLTSEIAAIKEQNDAQKQESEKNITALQDELQSQLAKKSVDAQMSKLDNMLSAMGKVTPADTVRTETQKSVDAPAKVSTYNPIDELFSGKVEN